MLVSNSTYAYIRGERTITTLLEVGRVAERRIRASVIEERRREDSFRRARSTESVGVADVGNVAAGACACGRVAGYQVARYGAGVPGVAEWILGAGK